jgi:hypothetical protein
MLLRFGVAPEEQQVTIGEERKTVARNALLDLLSDQPVGHERVLARRAIVEYEKRVFAVRRVDDALQREIPLLAFEAFQLPRGEVIAVGKDQPVILG